MLCFSKLKDVLFLNNLFLVYLFDVFSCFYFYFCFQNSQIFTTSTKRHPYTIVKHEVLLRCGTPKARNTMGIRAEGLRRDRRVFKNHLKARGFLALWHPRGPRSQNKPGERVCACVSYPGGRHVAGRPREAKRNDFDASGAALESPGSKQTPGS